MSLYFAAAPGCLAAAASSALALTSQRATMFSEETPARLEAPRPPVPMTAIFSLLRLRARTKAGAATVAPAAARNVRRVIRRRFMAGPFTRGRAQGGLCLGIVP